MKRIHIVEPYHSVAMRRMSEPLVAELAKIYEVTKGEAPDPSADLNYHIPFHTLAGYEGGGKHAIAYTHCNVGMEALLIDACERADLITCMSFAGRKELIGYGVDPAKLWVIYSAADQYAYKKRLIGIIGYPQPNGRKRESILLDLAWQYDMTPYQFLFIGAGWEELVDKLKSLGVEASTFHADSDDALRPFYHQIDLLLVTGYREGGPLPVLEAMASGTDILSPDFGYSSDLLDEDQIYTSLEDLADKLDDKFRPSINRHKLARAWRWQDYCSEHALIFGRLLNYDVDLYPEKGLSRYSQLLDIIDEEKPQDIVEIGTWNGNRAIQMIQEAAKFNPIHTIQYQGFDLFETQTAEQFRTELSKYGWDHDLVDIRIAATDADAVLYSGNTKYTLSNMLPADLYFVDGGHSEATIKNDGDAVLGMLGDGVAVFDDYYHEGKPYGMGCNKFIDGLDRNVYEVTHLAIKTPADDGRIIGMVKVRKNGAIPVQMQEWAYTTAGASNDGESNYFMPSMFGTNAQSTTGF